CSPCRPPPTSHPGRTALWSGLTTNWACQRRASSTTSPSFTWAPGRPTSRCAARTCMATRDAEPVFVDTNVLVYAHVAEAPWHQEAQAAIVDHEAAGAPLWISRQVLREYLVSLTRPQQFPIPPELATVVAQVQQFQQR